MIYCTKFAQAAPTNIQLTAEYERAIAGSSVEKSHFFGGRYENIYVPLEELPAIVPLKRWIDQEAAQLLKIAVDKIQSAFWFNVMQPGHATTRHHHQTEDELLSMVYYLQVSHNTGDLILYPKNGVRRITPTNGLAVFFPPDINHEVETNLSQQRRLSIAFNFGLSERNG